MGNPKPEHLSQRGKVYIASRSEPLERVFLRLREGLILPNLDYTVYTMVENTLGLIDVLEERFGES